MATSLTFARVRRDFVVLPPAGLDLATFLAAVAASVQRAAPHVATCMGTLDPATNLLTSTFKYGDLSGRDEQDHLWGLIEYGVDDDTTFASLLRSEAPAVGADETTGGAASSIPRIEHLIAPHYGYADELRLVGVTDDRAWGGLAIFRGTDDDPFNSTEVDFMSSLSTAYAAGLRTGMLARHAGPTTSYSVHGPTVLVVGADDQLNQMSSGAESVLSLLSPARHQATASGILGSLVAGARRFAAGTTATPPRARVRMGDGRWLVLHASPLTAMRADGQTTGGDVVITIEEARPPEIVPLVVAAFGLTARERDVVQLVLQGEGTKEIATALHMSRYTVQDHLKAIFDKADVRSRRELVSRVFFDQYADRMGSDLAPSGWFAGPHPA